MNEHMISCEEAIRLLAAFLDGDLAEPDGERVSDHLQRCRSCYSRGEFERKLKGQLAALRTTEVSSVLEQRVRTILQNFGTA